MQTHELLKRYYRQKKKTTRGFSLSSLAKELGLSTSFVSRMLNGVKPIPEETLSKFEAALDIEKEVFAAILRKRRFATSASNAKTTETEVEHWELGEMSQARILRQWFYLPILESTTLKNYDGSVAFISRLLGLSIAVTEVAVRELCSLGLLEDDAGMIRKTKKKIRWATAKSQAEVRLFHHQMMSKAQAELESATTDEDFQRRLITGITLTLSPEQVEPARQRLMECLYGIANDLTEQPGSEVYHLAAQFFPLSRK